MNCLNLTVSICCRYNLFDRVVVNKNAKVSEKYEKVFKQELQRKIKDLQDLSQSTKQKLNAIPTFMEASMRELNDCETTVNAVKALYKDSISELKNNKKELVEFMRNFVKYVNMDSASFREVFVITDSDSDTDDCKEVSVEYRKQMTLGQESLSTSSCSFDKKTEPRS